MRPEGPTAAEVPADLRPGALLIGGLRRGALLVFVPVFGAGQLLAIVGFAVTGWYGVWSWSKIGLAESLMSARVAFEASVAPAGGAGGTDAGRLVVATGALTIAVIVLSFRAGREQGRGLENRPLAAASAGSGVGLGFGVPALVAALPLSLRVDRFGVSSLEPVLVQALVLPTVVAGAAGAFGGVTRARASLIDRRGVRIVGAVEGGAAAMWWGVVLAFVGALLAAALSPGPVGSYARIVDDAGATGAAVVVQQALLLPNGSVLVLATSMGATTTLGVGAGGAIELTGDGIHANGAAGSFVAAAVGARGTEIAAFPWWFAGFWLVPAVAAILGGRRGAADARTIAGRVSTGAASGVVFGALCAIGVWAASIRIPAPVGRVDALTIGASPFAAGVLALGWGIVGGAVGGAIPWPARLSAGRGRPR